MAALVCDLCGGKLVMGAGGIATCDSCGMEHSPERMREKVQEVKGVVQTDSSHLVAKSLDMAITALDTRKNAETEACSAIVDAPEVIVEQIMDKILKNDEAFLDFLSELSEVFAVKYLCGEDLSSAVESIMGDDKQKVIVQEYLINNY